MDTELPDGFRLLILVFAASLLSCEVIQYHLHLGADEFMDDYMIIFLAIYALFTGVLGRLPFFPAVASPVSAADGSNSDA